MDNINKRLLFSLVIVIFGFIGILAFNHNASIASHKKTEDIVILIDPGHGGMDGGASSSSGTVEKNINLEISKFVQKELEKKGFKVILTREDDCGLYDDEGTVKQKKNQDLSRRCELKKETKCNMFLSIHLNKFPEGKYKGSQVWYSDHEKSKELALLLQQKFKEDIDPNNNRQIKAAGNQYKVLRVNDDMPSVIIECGFLSNYEEEQLLKTEEYQRKLSISIANAVEEYYRKN